MKFLISVYFCLFFCLLYSPAFCEIEWEHVSKFFKFGQNESSLQENVKLAIENQLSLQSGQKLWKAFLFFDETNKARTENAFSFVFNCIEGTELGFSLNNYNTSAHRFVLDIIHCTKNESVYRPFLIKLNDEYHFGGQIEVPFFIGLAHELFHALNSLEMIDFVIKNDLCGDFFTTGCMETLNDVISIQEFLKVNLGIDNDDKILQEEYKKWWTGNGLIDDSLDEMTVILGKNRKISDNEEVNVGEVHMLREFHSDTTIIPWSHYAAQNAYFWKNGDILLEKDYVISVQKYFPCVERFIDEIHFKFPSDIKYQTVYRISIGIRELSKLFDFICEESSRIQGAYAMIIDIVIDYKSCQRASKREFWKFVVYPPFCIQNKNKNKPINIIPKFYQLEKHPAAIIDDPWLQGYEIIDVPEDGNCAFSAVIVDASSYNVAGLRKDTAEKMESLSGEQRPTKEFIYIIKRNGCWNSGIDGGVGIEVLSFVADVIKRPILVLTKDNNGKLCYWISGTTKCPRDGNLTMYPITSSAAATKILNEHYCAVKIFHNGVHFKAIMRQEPSPFGC